MASRHLDKLVKSFISGSSNPAGNFDSFKDLQDPTYMTFKLDFFPDMGMSMPDDLYSTGGLFRKGDGGGLTDYGFYDSAADYFARIGSPSRQKYLEIFTNLLYRIQEEAPWYFQSVAGLSDLYKIDPANNFRGKDKVLTIECLESIDLRMSLLADTYRNLSFEVQGMREVLPINLRTFNMHVHVLEFRKFNTTFGVIADAISGSERTLKGQANQQAAIDAKRKNVFPKTSLFSGTFDNINNAVANVNSQLGGLFSYQAAGSDFDTTVESAFEAISVQTFVLKDCEFDFFSEAPGYLDNVSVKEMPEATHKFKIKVGKIRKTSTYSFDKYVISEYAKYSSINPNTIPTSDLGRGTITASSPYFDEITGKVAESKYYADLRESIFPTNSVAPNKASADAYSSASKDSEYLRKKPLERLLGGLIQNAIGGINSGINSALGDLTGGILGNKPMPFGNVYGDRQFLANSARELNGFLSQANQLGTRRSTGDTLRNIKFEALNIDRTPPSGNLFGQSFINKQGQFARQPELTTKNVYNGSLAQDASATVDNNVKLKENIFSGIVNIPMDNLGKENIFSQQQFVHTEGINKDNNIFYQTPKFPEDQVGNVNVFNNNLPIPNQNDDIGKDNVFGNGSNQKDQQFTSSDQIGKANVFKK